jgi:hypothetical protein
MGNAGRGWEGNPIAALAISRCRRSRWLAAWVLAPVFLAGPVSLLFSQRPAFLTPVLHVMLLDRSSPGSGETFVLPIALVALLLLTVVGTVPQATLGIARERERRTLEPLLLTRMSPTAILAGELVQVLLTPVLATLALMPLLCLSYCLGSISIARILAVEGALLLCHLFFATISLCGSCWCRRSGLALLLGYSVVLVTTVGTMLVWKLLPGAGGPEPGWRDGVLALNPATLLLDVVVPQGGMPAGSDAVPWCVVGAGAYALLSAGCFALGLVGLRRRWGD